MIFRRRITAVLLLALGGVSLAGWHVLGSTFWAPPRVPPPLPTERTAFIESTEPLFKQQRAAGGPTWIRLFSPTLTPTDLQWLAAQPDLARVSINSDSEFGDGELEILAQSVSLRHLDLSHTSITDRGLESIGTMTQLRSLRLRAIGRHRDNITDAGIRHLSGLSHLERLDLSANRQLTDEALASVADLRRLWSLNLGRLYGVTGDGLRHLSDLTRIERLFLADTSITDDDLRHLRSLSRLKELTLPYPRDSARNSAVAKSGIAGPGLRHLWGLPIEKLGVTPRAGGLANFAGLTELRELPQFMKIGDHELPLLRRLHRLKSLHVTLTDGWSDTSRLADLRPLRSLSRLTISGRPAKTEAAREADGLKTLAALPALTELRLLGPGDEVLPHLSGCDQLRVLDLRQTRVTGVGLRHLAGAKRLTTLALDGRRTTDAGLAELRHLPTLRHLVLGQGGSAHTVGLVQLGYDREWSSHPTHWTSAGIAELTALQRLKTLDLSNLPVTDADLVQLARLRSLEELDLSRTKITNVASLAGAPRLQTLAITSTGVTDAGVLPLRASNVISLEIYGTEISYQTAEVIYAARNQQCEISDNWCCGCMAFSRQEHPASTDNR